MQGTVTSFDERHGYGFITVDSLDYAVFVHIRAVATPFVSHLQVGQQVAFDLVTDLNAPRAANVTLVDRTSPRLPSHRTHLRTPRRAGGVAAASQRLHLPALIRCGSKDAASIEQGEIAQTGDCYTLSRVLDAPVAKAWEVWTRPEHWARWLNGSVASAYLDLRPGGSWQLTLTGPDGAEYPMSGSYGEIVPHQRLVTLMHVPGHPEPRIYDVRFADLGNHTKIVLSRTGAADDHREQARATGEMALGGLSTYLSQP